ncbi:MAG: ABC transporter permease [Lachnospiraceae bacterium]|nr:ABC transporter permease [Lachnospiraceae bacterium]
MEREIKEVKHKGRIAQTGIYLGKLFRMFIFQSDWKVLPMAAVIAGLVCFVVGNNLFVTMEGTLLGTFALSCICIWNGFFNSIQVICRERAIVKREHRSGMHISSYIAAHMIYQAFLCLCQSVITIQICRMMKVTFPAVPQITASVLVDIGITLFLTTYAADMMALMVSAFVHNTTTAMTIMPFLLIFQLVFSGGFFSLEGFSLKLTNLTVAKWGLTALCTQADYNHLPMVLLWNSAYKLKDIEINLDNKEEITNTVKDELSDVFVDQEVLNEVKDILVAEGIDLDKPLSNEGAEELNLILKREGIDVQIQGKKPVWEVMHYIEENGMRDELLLKSAEFNQNPSYDGGAFNVLKCWSVLILFIAVFSGLSVISLEFIDKDKR